MSAAAPLLARGFTSEDLQAITLDPTKTGDPTYWPWAGALPWSRIAPDERGAVVLEAHDWAREKWATEHATQPRWAKQVARLWELTTKAETARVTDRAKGDAARLAAELIDTLPLADHGSKFAPGRQKGAVGAIRKKVGQVLKIKRVDGRKWTAELVWAELEGMGAKWRPYYCSGYDAGRTINCRSDDTVQMGWRSFMNTMTDARGDVVKVKKITV